MADYNNYNLTNIRNLLNDGFTDEELRRFCYDTPDFRPAYDELSQETGKAKIADRLIEYADRKLLIEDLLTWAKQHNPRRYENYEPYHNPPHPTTPNDVQDKFSHILLTQEQEELFLTLVEAAQNTPLEKRQKFEIIHTQEKNFIRHPGLRGRNNMSVYMGDLDILASEGLIILSKNSSLSSFDVTPLGYAYHQQTLLTASELREFLNEDFSRLENALHDVWVSFSDHSLLVKYSATSNWDMITSRFTDIPKDICTVFDKVVKTRELAWGGPTKLTKRQLSLAKQGINLILEFLHQRFPAAGVELLSSRKKEAMAQVRIRESGINKMDRITGGLNIDLALAFVFGVVFVLVLLFLSIAFPNPSPFQEVVFRIILSLAAAGVAAVIPGLINFKFSVGTSSVLRAAGALAVFAIVYFWNPPQSVIAPIQSASETIIVIPTSTNTFTPTLTPLPTFTPTPNSTQISLATALPTGNPSFHPQKRITDDGIEQVWVPPGSFIAGDQSGIGYSDEISHQVYIDGFWIDRFLVTNAQFASCSEEICGNPKQSISHKRPNGYYGVSAYDNFPVIEITWQQATDYCHWRGGRLPTEAEFEKAAGWDPRTGKTWIYPWGNQQPNRSLANFYNVDVDTTPVNKYPFGASPIDAYDMAGNVWQWTSDWYSDTYYVSNQEWINPAGPSSGTQRVVRGGSWASGHKTDPAWKLLRVANRGKKTPSETGNEFGFRCVFNE
jgi:formylglycine-generating enzyme required for sulfatase activity